MSRHFSETEAISSVSRLTRARLVSFIELEMISPLRSHKGLLFRQIDLVRMELLCELSDDFDIKDDALGVVISLIDQLHDTRRSLKTVLSVIERQPQDIRDRISDALRALN